MTLATCLRMYEHFKKQGNKKLMNLFAKRIQLKGGHIPSDKRESKPKK